MADFGGTCDESTSYPAEVLKGHRGRFIAHRVYGRRVLRVIYEYDGTTPTVITLTTRRLDGYFQGRGTYEDQHSPEADVLTIQLREGKLWDSR